MIQNIVGDKNQVVTTSGGDAASKTQKLAEKLETLRDLYNRKRLSKAEYEAESQKAVREYTAEPTR